MLVRLPTLARSFTAGLAGNESNTLNKSTFLLAGLLATFGVGLSSFSVAQLSAVSNSSGCKPRQYFPKAPWD